MAAILNEEDPAVLRPSSVREPARDIPLIQRSDICIIGGSCTGVFAAVRAARLGATVSLIENNGYFGGTATAAMVNVWHSLYDDRREQQIIAGLTLEILERLEKRGAVDRFVTHNVFNSAELILELDALVGEHPRIRPFLQARFAAPVVQDGRLTAVIIEDKSGRRAIAAAQFIDASGDGDLIRRLGLPTRKNKSLQPPTMCALFSGIPAVERANPDMSISRDVFHPAYAERLPAGYFWLAEVPGAADDLRMVAGTRIHDVDCSDADDLTRAMIAGRSQVRAIRDILHEQFREGDRAAIIALPPAIGIRETHHAVCRHHLREAEVLAGRRFADGIANSRYPVDIHLPDRAGTLLRYLDGTEKFFAPGLPPEMRRWRAAGDEAPRFYQVPFASLAPQDSANVLVAGRLLDADPGAYGAARVMVTCNQMGEAAGVAAALALGGQTSAGDVPPQTLRQALRAGGSLIL